MKICKECLKEGIKTMPSHDDIKHQYTLLASYRTNLAHYLRQVSGMDTNLVPVMHKNGIREARDNIARIKGILREWHQPVEDHPDDTDDKTAIRLEVAPGYSILVMKTEVFDAIDGLLLRHNSGYSLFDYVVKET